MRVTQGPALRDCGCPALPMLRRRAGKLDVIAERVGYGSASAFSTAFTRQVGMPPKRYAMMAG